MQAIDVLRQRLREQRLEGGHFESPLEVVRWLGAVQSQDFGGAAWGVCQRTERATASDFAKTFARGDILRTHVMRPTWHFVAADDIRWLLDLTRPRLFQALSYNFRRFGLGEEEFAQTDTIIHQALEGGKQLTRAQLAEALAAKHIDVRDTVRLSHIIFHAEGEGIICSGAPTGKQQTYALLAERAPNAKKLTKEAAIAELARRYFAGHGPTTLEDYAWWSGLTKTAAQAGLKAVERELQKEEVEGKTYWFMLGEPRAVHATPNVHLLPNYDEYVVAYTDRTALLSAVRTDKLDSRQNPLFNNVLVVDGVILGTWKKAERPSGVTFNLNTFRKLTADEQDALQHTTDRYAAYLGLPKAIIEGL